MKIKLLVATADLDYADHLSAVISEKYADAFEIIVCTSENRLRDLLSGGKFEIVLADPGFISLVNASSVTLLVCLADDEYTDDEWGDIKRIGKYQRISSIVGNILEYYSQISGAVKSTVPVAAHISAVWSPSGGSGKTSVALAYAAYKVSEGKKATYVSLENFASTSAYFQGAGKSISKAFEKFESESNLRMYLTAIRQTDSASGISYFGEPENYEDMNILSAEDIENLVKACAAETEELVVDLSSVCDARVKKVFELADAVLLVCDPSSTAQTKLRQFFNQHDVFGKIQSKIVLINNKGANTPSQYIEDIKKTIQLPFVPSADPVFVEKTLSHEYEKFGLDGLDGDLI